MFVDCLGNGVQLMGLIRTFIDPDNMMVVVNVCLSSILLWVQLLTDRVVLL